MSRRSGSSACKGPGAVALLERLYPNRFADQPVGRVRYGVMLNDEGVIVDDGAVVRVAEDEFFVTVTSGNTGALERWMTWWQADWNFDVRLLNVTGGFAAINLAGPASRDVMTKVTDADVSADALPYLGAVSMDVAGVPALVLRIGFVGELGYEIHFPSMYGEHVWTTVMAAGADLGIRAIRSRGPAHPPPGEAAHPGGPGHRRRIRSLRGGPGLDGQG